EGIPFVKNMVIEEPEYGMFFIYVFGDEAFQRMNEILTVDIETLLTDLVMASDIITLENQRFCLKLRKLIGSHLNQDKLNSKKTKENPLKEHGIQSALSTVAQAPSHITSGRKRKHQELEHEIRILRLECKRSLPEGIPFVKNMVIEEPEYGMFFIYVFGD
nr:hypothetical protein [Tanacetum cinerariifolium]